MLRRMSFCAVLLSLAAGAVALATVEPPEMNGKLEKEMELDPFGSRRLPAFTFVGKQTAGVVWVGNATPPASLAVLGVYVYDANGNCVAWDDLLTSRGKTDRLANAVAVQWVPAETGPFTVELVNLSGIATDKTEFTAK